MKVKRENFKKMVCRHYGGFTFQAEWWISTDEDGRELDDCVRNTVMNY